MTETGYLGRLSNEACGRYLEVNSRVNSRSILGSILGPKLSKTGPKNSKTGTELSKTGPETVKT